MVKIKRKKVVAPSFVTLEHSVERQQQIAQSKTTGGRWLATGGCHLTHDDFFLADLIKDSENEIDRLKCEKEARLAAAERQSMALKLIEDKERQGFPLEKITDPEVEKRWKVKDLDTLLKWKIGKIPADAKKKADKLIAWQRVKNDPNPPCLPWTDADEDHLKNLQATPSIEDSLLGKERQKLKQGAVAALAHMSKEELIALQAQAASRLEAIEEDPDA